MERKFIFVIHRFINHFIHPTISFYNSINMRIYIVFILLFSAQICLGQFDKNSFTLFAHNYTPTDISEFSKNNINYGDSLYHSLIFKGDSVAFGVYHFMAKDRVINAFTLNSYFEWVERNYPFTKVDKDGDKLNFVFKTDFGNYNFTCTIINDDRLLVQREIQVTGAASNVKVLNYVKLPYKKN